MIKDNILSKNFTRREFSGKGLPAVLTINQQAMLDNIVNNILQPVRDRCKKGIRITDCFRTIEKAKSMIARGYNPSTTSDHFWGQAIPLRQLKKRKTYGPVYYYSVGAVDMQAWNPKETFFLFNMMYDMSTHQEIKIGQLIYEENPDRKTSWIHVANPVSLIYSDEFIKKYPFLVKTKYLTSYTNGKTYKVFK